MKNEGYTSLGRFIDLLLDAICVVDKSGRFEFVSAGAERIFGYTPDEMIGMQMLDLVLPEDRERTLAAANEIMTDHYKIDFENRYIRKDGSIVDILWSARWSDEYQQRVAVARDITKNKNAERRQAALYEISGGRSKFCVRLIFKFPARYLNVLQNKSLTEISKGSNCGLAWSIYQRRLICLRKVASTSYFH